MDQSPSVKVTVILLNFPSMDLPVEHILPCRPSSSRFNLKLHQAPPIILLVSFISSTCPLLDLMISLENYHVSSYLGGIGMITVIPKLVWLFFFTMIFFLLFAYYLPSSSPANRWCFILPTSMHCHWQELTMCSQIQQGVINDIFGSSWVNWPSPRWLGSRFKWNEPTGTSCIHRDTSGWWSRLPNLFWYKPTNLKIIDLLPVRFTNHSVLPCYYKCNHSIENFRIPIQFFDRHPGLMTIP